MQHFELKGQTRQTGSKAKLNALRKQGLIPCNLYGCGVDNVIFTIDAKDLKTLTSTPQSFIIDLVIDNAPAQTAVLHELQWHPVSDECLHVDFLAVNDTKPVSINVPIEITGHAAGVQQGGKFYQSLRNLRISALMANLPDKISVDITPLGLDKRLKAGDVVVENAVVLTDKDTIVCGVKAPRKSGSSS